MLIMLLEFFNKRTSGEQVFLLISGGILFFVLGIQIGRLAYALLHG